MTRGRSGSGDEAADTALELSQGDYFVLPPLVAGEIRNEGQEPVSIVIAAITPGLIPGTAIGDACAGVISSSALTPNRHLLRRATRLAPTGSRVPGAADSGGHTHS